jgi:hypothetical protein
MVSGNLPQVAAEEVGQVAAATLPPKADPRRQPLQAPDVQVEAEDRP